MIATLNRPGGNATGVSLLTVAMEAKRLQLLHELMPNSLPNSPPFAGILRVQMRNVRSPLPAEVAKAQILAPGLWAPQTRSWRRPEL
jgi:hypothetical protein